MKDSIFLNIELIKDKFDKEYEKTFENKIKKIFSDKWFQIYIHNFKLSNKEIFDIVYEYSNIYGTKLSVVIDNDVSILNLIETNYMNLDSVIFINKEIFEKYSKAIKKLGILVEYTSNNLENEKIENSSLWLIGNKIKEDIKMIEIRKGTPEDLEQITYINRKTWKTAYPNIIEQEFLDNLPLTIPKEQLELKKKEIIDGEANYIVAVDGDNVVGMLKYLKYNHDDYENTAEIQALYVLDDYQKKGIGSKMVSMATKEMTEKKYKNMIIGCLDGNTANDFYKKIGRKEYWKKRFCIK